jgi:hypothetical protein
MKKHKYRHLQFLNRRIIRIKLTEMKNAEDEWPKIDARHTLVTSFSDSISQKLLTNIFQSSSNLFI